MGDGVANAVAVDARYQALATCTCPAVPVLGPVQKGALPAAAHDTCHPVHAGRLVGSGAEGSRRSARCRPPYGRRG